MFIKKFLYCLVIVTSSFSIQGANLPKGVVGTAIYDFFTEHLPSASKGIYQIYSLRGQIKYIGSTQNINKRLLLHHKNGILVLGDIVNAIIFHPSVRQREILDYEKALIEKFKPILNKHTGAPGRPWQAEQISKLHTFYEHNETLLTTEGQKEIRRILEGKDSEKNRKLKRSLFRIMGIFR